ncbi:MAG: tetratricopeptide repeat protein, partial [Candidatus Latescibacteria bacterium]|nr:tetratricopeptide repeat protein [Candidatus Latescibacterota bacterium]
NSRNQKNANQPTLSLCMIAKDEAGFLRRCLASVKGLADEILVGDTGSSDGTKLVATQAGAVVIDVAWTGDFSEARNAVLDRATKDWVLVLDCDEVLAKKDLTAIRKAIASKRALAYRMTTRNYAQSGNRVGWQSCLGDYAEEKTYLGWFPTTKVRVFQNDERIRFEGAVHELVEGTIKKMDGNIGDLSVPVHHYGYIEKDRPNDLYAEAAQQKAETTPDNPEAFYQLAISLRDVGDFKGAKEAIEQCIDLVESNGISQTEYLQLDFVHLVHGDVLGRSGDQISEEAAYLRALGVNAKSYHALNNLGTLKQRMGDLDMALDYYEKALQLAPEIDTIRENVAKVKQLQNENLKFENQNRQDRSDAQPTTPDGGRLTLCMIAKNEGHRLDKCLESVRGLVDEIVVVDTGSTDNTMDIAKQYGAKTGFFEWCDDFAAARNVSLSLATGDWIMWLDPDDVLPQECHAKIREVMRYGLNKKKAFYWVLDDQGFEPVRCLQMRLFPNLPGVKFTMPIHEQVTPSLADIGVVCETTDIRVEHYGYSSPEIVEEKQKRYLGIMQSWLETHPEDYIVRSHAAMTYYIQGKLDQAIEEYQRIIDDGNAHSDRNLVIETTSTLYLGRCLMRQQKYEDALPYLLDAQKMDDQYVISNLTLGECYTRMARHKDALEALNQALEFENQVTFSATDMTSAKYSIRFFKGQNLEALERFGEAADFYKQAADADPKRGDALGRLSGIYRLLGQRDDAIGAIDEALNRDPDNAQYRFNRGTFYLELGNETEAVRWFKRALEKNPDMPEPYLNLGYVMRRQGDLKTAEEMYVQAVDRSDDTAYEAHANFAHLLLDQARYGEADALLEEVQNRNPNLTDILLGLCVTRAHKGALDDVRMLLGPILSAVYGGTLQMAIPDQAGVNDLAALLSECGNMLSQQEQGVCARLSFLAASCLNKSPENMLQLADIYKRTGDVWKAIDVFESLIRHQPTNPDLFRQLGECYRAIGSEASAQMCEQQVQALTR